MLINHRNSREGCIMLRLAFPGKPHVARTMVKNRLGECVNGMQLIAWWRGSRGKLSTAGVWKLPIRD